MKLLNREFAWDRNSLSHADTVSGVPCIIGKGMFRESINKMRNEKDAEPSAVLPEMVEAAGNTEVDMITDLLNQIIVEWAILAESQLSTIVNCCKRKGDSLVGRN